MKVGKKQRIFGDVTKFTWTTTVEVVRDVKIQALTEGRTASEILLDGLYMYLDSVKKKSKKIDQKKNELLLDDEKAGK